MLPAFVFCSPTVVNDWLVAMMKDARGDGQTFTILTHVSPHTVHLCCPIELIMLWLVVQFSSIDSFFFLFSFSRRWLFVTSSHFFVYTHARQSYMPWSVDCISLPCHCYLLEVNKCDCWELLIFLHHPFLKVRWEKWSVESCRSFEIDHHHQDVFLPFTPWFRYTFARSLSPPRARGFFFATLSFFVRRWLSCLTEI